MIILNTNMSIIIEDYSAKSIVVYGDTKVYKDKLKELGGKYNGNLSVGPGWIFSNKKKEEIMEWKETLPPPVDNSVNKYVEEIEKLKKMNKELIEENERLRK